MSNNLTEIIPGLYIGTWEGSDVLGNIITINKPIKSEMNIMYLELELDLNVLYLKDKLHTEKIDFDMINNFILESYKRNENTIIYSDDIIISLIICIQFIIKYININIIEAIYYVCKKTNIESKILPKYQIFEIFNNYVKNIDKTK